MIPIGLLRPAGRGSVLSLCFVDHQQSRNTNQTVSAWHPSRRGLSASSRAPEAGEGRGAQAQRNLPYTDPRPHKNARASPSFTEEISERRP
jgi:hypothetical protein